MSLSQKIIDAAEAGDTAAQCRIANFYYKGEEVSKNLLEAEKWWRKAAEMGIPEAQYNLGFFCFEHIGVDESHTWLEKSANNGCQDAQIFLGVLYFWGWGATSRNRITSLKWLILGSERNEKLKWPRRIYCTIVKLLSGRSQILEAKRLAEEWRHAFRTSHKSAG